MPDLHPQLVQTLSQVIYPEFAVDIVGMGLVTQATLREGVAGIVLRPLAAPAEKLAALEAHIKEALLALGTVRQVELSWGKAPAAKGEAGSQALAGVKRLVAVTSCKGGVGKSTLTINLARACAELGLKTGILDLDLYGPSLPTMLGGGPAAISADDQGRLNPWQYEGLQVLSLGYMTQEGQALIWRGPMLIKAVNQLLHKSNWRDLDILLIDLPPGTGDVQMSLLKHIILDGVVVVTTSQEAALSDTRRGIDLFRRSNVPITGLLENMSHFVCPCCQTVHYLFGKDAARPLAQELGLNFLGAIALNPELQKLTAGRGGNRQDLMKPYIELAENIMQSLKG